VTGLRLREAARVVVIDDLERVLLVRFEFPGERTFWATVGGGLEAGETHEDAARRELSEEAGIDGVELGPWIWRREHHYAGLSGFDGQRERYVLLRTPCFEPAPRQTWEQLASEGVTAVRWWTVDEVEAARSTSFAPRKLASLLRELLETGPPPEPIVVGV
jgi:8-oxo-dGTP pyrophosphatase MutT (NUDIX family)